ncbi:MAG TPA: NAD/NADP octopine/nopaline dehydrogenase family protein [Anaerolineales bacterium]|nr:NAD/NADP octopine/nopaline dehydrogenase family protein [Anaerolineales bacterium]
MGTIKNISVFGAGHGGKAMAAHLAISGANVTLYNRTWKNIQAIKERGGISLSSTSELSGFGEMYHVTSNIEEAVKNSQILMIVVPAFAHADIAKKISPYLENGQIIVLNPGRTFGAFEVRKILSETGCEKDVIVSETQTFIYASRSEGPAQAFIHRIKDAVPLAAFPATQTKLVLEALSPYYPQFIDGKTVLHTGLDNIGAIFHPTITLHNAGWIEATGGDFQFYIQGVTPSIARVMEAIDRERIRVGKALGIQLLTACDWLKLAYDSQGENLFEAIRNQEGYRGISAPPTVNHRYINEDIPMSLVPMASLGQILGIRVRGMESIIRLASIIRKVDYWESGRTVERLGLSHQSMEELLSMVLGKSRKQHVQDKTAWYYMPAG